MSTTTDTQGRTPTEDEIVAVMVEVDEYYHATVNSAWAAYRRRELSHREYETIAMAADKARADGYDQAMANLA